MEKMLDAARSGSWLTPERMRIYPLLLLAIAAASICAMLALSHGRMGPDHNQLGTDFSQVWVAGNEALRGHPDEPFDVARHIAEQRAEFGADSAVYGWHYPPYFLAPAALLAHLPYLPALFLWQLSTLTLYLLVMAAIARRFALNPGQIIIAALAFPATLVNLGHGQNGFLTAALLGGGFLALEKRPALAGVLFALLAYKPHLALVLPLALVLDRRWRALAAAAATLAVMTGATIAEFGLRSWSAFFESLDFTRRIAVEQGAAGFAKIQSVFAGVRLLGGDVAAAYALQAVATAATIAALFWLWRSSADFRLKSAATLTATLLTTPYCLDYDMMALAPALALLAAHGREKGFAPFEKTILAVAFMAPFVARPFAVAVSFPFGVSACILLFASIVLRARKGGADEASLAGASA
ncbi:glycosyltransferase family 87 protein [Methylocystis heyeri]|nr:glycosyltransferase family 87 protein [Methylocystis heyeri]